MGWLSHFTTLLVVLSVMPFGVQSGPEERRLINDLLDRYQTLERPVFNESEPLNLKFGLTLQQIIDVELKENGYEDETSKCFLQTFEKSDIDYLKGKTKLKRVFLMGSIWKEIA